MSDIRLYGGFQPKPPPTDPAEIHFKRAWQLRKEKRYREAVEEFLASLKHNPDRGATHFNLAWVYDKLGESRPALDHLLQAVECFRKEGQEANAATAGNLLKKFRKKYPDPPPGAP